MANTLGKDNPFRYRGYVWDEETGLYYLRSRYYDPSWGRFVNADKLTGVGNTLSTK
ncbi:MAG: RHS repeat-associated core domain-containing protein [Lawsonibacter sp.]|nr:RHS repeat-associated core domain-containing protein [Lawsonibacter sp.]